MGENEKNVHQKLVLFNFGELSKPANECKTLEKEW